jgi:hypothetical protein
MPATVAITVGTEQSAWCVDVPAKRILGDWAIHRPYVTASLEDAIARHVREDMPDASDAARARELSSRLCRERVGWNVTHIPTGLRALHCADLRTANAALTTLADLKLQPTGRSVPPDQTQKIKRALWALKLCPGSADQRLPEREEVNA